MCRYGCVTVCISVYVCVCVCEQSDKVQGDLLSPPDFLCETIPLVRPWLNKCVCMWEHICAVCRRRISCRMPRADSSRLANRCIYMLGFSADAVYLCSQLSSLSLSALCWWVSIGLLCPLSGRLLCVCACVSICALLVQEADSREVCLNRQGVQRPCASCRVWIPVTGPLFSPSISVFISFFNVDTISASHYLHYHFYFLPLHSSFACVPVGTCVRAQVCRCVSECCDVSAPGSTHWSAVLLLSTLSCCWILGMHVVLP